MFSLKKSLLVLFFLLTSLSLTSVPVFADYNSVLTDYNFQYTNYRAAYSRFTVSRSTYLTYQTLTAQNAAIADFKTVLTSRNRLVSSYFDLLQEKMNITPNIDPPDLQAFTGKRQSTKEWLDDNQKKLNNALTIEDLNTLSDEFNSRYQLIQLDSLQAVGRILLAKGANLDRKVALAFDKTQEVAQFLSADGTDISPIQRGLIQAKIKRDLSTDKAAEEKDLFFGKNATRGNQINLLQGQQLAIAANQYLRESVSYVLEILKPIIGE